MVTFAAIGVGITNKEKQQMLNEVLALDDTVHHYNEFRGCSMIAIYNGGGRLGGRVTGIDTKAGEFKYTLAGEQCTTIQRVCEEKIFPFMDPPGRVTILRTAPNTGLNIHLDSKLKEVGTKQDKYRVVLNGTVDKLFFLDNKLNKVYVPNYYDSYILDGSHPHSIDPSVEEKITLCIGAPWHGEENKLYTSLIEKSAFKMTVSRPTIKDEWLDPALKK